MKRSLSILILFLALAARGQQVEIVKRGGTTTYRFSTDNMTTLEPTVAQVPLKVFDVCFDRRRGGQYIWNGLSWQARELNNGEAADQVYTVNNNDTLTSWDCNLYNRAMLQLTSCPSPDTVYIPAPSNFLTQTPDEKFVVDVYNNRSCDADTMYIQFDSLYRTFDGHLLRNKYWKCPPRGRIALAFKVVQSVEGYQWLNTDDILGSLGHTPGGGNRPDSTLAAQGVIDSLNTIQLGNPTSTTTSTGRFFVNRFQNLNAKNYNFGDATKATLFQLSGTNDRVAVGGAANTAIGDHLFQILPTDAYAFGIRDIANTYWQYEMENTLGGGLLRLRNSSSSQVTFGYNSTLGGWAIRSNSLRFYFNEATGGPAANALWNVNSTYNIAPGTPGTVDRFYWQHSEVGTFGTNTGGTYRAVDYRQNWTNNSTNGQTIVNLTLAPTLAGTAASAYRALDILNTVGIGIYQVSLLIDNVLGGDTGIGETNPDAKLHVNGSTRLQGALQKKTVTITSASSPYTVTSSDYQIVVDASGGNVTINLPTATSSYDATDGVGRQLSIQKIDSSANTVTIAANGSDTIRGAASIVLTAQWQYSVTQTYSSTAWAAY